MLHLQRILFPIKWIALLLLALLIGTPNDLSAGRKPVAVRMHGDRAEATHVKGNTFEIENDVPTGPSIEEGAVLLQGHRFATDTSSRIELKLPDDSFLRFDERTTFELSAVGYDPQEKRRSISIRMILGKTWANVSKLVGKSSRFEITAKTAVMGVRGTVYRVNVAEDDTVVVKVYWGEILLKSKSAADNPQPTAKLGKPSKVMGPQVVAGPRPVSMEEWSHIVSAMQQIVVKPDGTATKPFRFSPEEDMNDWVQWNKERDEKMGRQQG